MPSRDERGGLETELVFLYTPQAGALLALLVAISGHGRGSVVSADSDRQSNPILEGGLRTMSKITC
jgi:hypothetical protein